MTIARPPVVSQTEWDAALTALTEREKSVAAAMHELAAARKRMPMVRVGRDYRFEGQDGQRSLPELFEGRSQLILYRFFFEEGVAGWPDAGCVGCSSVADGIPELGLLHSRDITFAMASPAPQRWWRLARKGRHIRHVRKDFVKVRQLPAVSVNLHGECIRKVCAVRNNLRRRKSASYFKTARLPH